MKSQKRGKRTKDKGEINVTKKKKKGYYSIMEWLN